MNTEPPASSGITPSKCEDEMVHRKSLAESTARRRIFVHNIKFMKQGDLAKLLKKHGIEQYQRIDKVTRHQYGFVTFDTEEAANKAVEAMKGVTDRKNRPILVKISNPKEVKFKKKRKKKVTAEMRKMFQKLQQMLDSVARDRIQRSGFAKARRDVEGP